MIHRSENIHITIYKQDKDFQIYKNVIIYIFYLNENL